MILFLVFRSSFCFTGGSSVILRCMVEGDGFRFYGVRIFIFRRRIFTGVVFRMGDYGYVSFGVRRSRFFFSLLI